MKNIIFASFLMLLLSVRCNVDSHSVESDRFPFFVLFENYYNNNLCISDSLLEQFAKTEVVLSDTIFSETNRNFDTISKIEGKLLELLSESDTVNGWAFNPNGAIHDGKIRNDFICGLKQERALYYLGEIPISKHFRSWVLLSNNKLNNFEFRQYEVFIVNMRNQFVKSIIRVHDYCSYWGDSGSTMTMKEGKNLFLQKQFIESSDNTIPDEYLLIPDNEGNYPYDPAVRFRFDRNGFVEIVECIEQ
ncbi:hypothetical protein [Bacteroides heparinolyticus]|uniref:hypothetical protein n=1 Tax=Prevotella heparinolytica TaxID=28113 RepID=UPI0035A12EF6